MYSLFIIIIIIIIIIWSSLSVGKYARCYCQSLQEALRWSCVNVCVDRFRLRTSLSRTRNVWRLVNWTGVDSVAILAFLIIKWHAVIYRAIKKSLCIWWSQYKKQAKTQCIRTIPTRLMIWRWPSQNTFGMWTVIYWTQSSRTQFGVSINVWRLAGDTLNITCNFLYCNHQVHRDFLIILYNRNTMFIISLFHGPLSGKNPKQIINLHL
jgi:hypothetical protein